MRRSHRRTRRSRSRRSRRRTRSNVHKWSGFKEYMHNGMINKSFTILPLNKKIQIVKEAIKIVKHQRAKKNMEDDLKYLQGVKRRSRRFGYSHDQGPQIYNAHMDDGILLADNAFSWEGNPLERSLNAG